MAWLRHPWTKKENVIKSLFYERQPQKVSITKADFIELELVGRKIVEVYYKNRKF